MHRIQAFAIEISSRPVCYVTFQGIPGSPAREGKGDGGLFTSTNPMVTFFRQSGHRNQRDARLVQKEGVTTSKRDDSKTSARSSTTWTYVIKTHDYDCHQQLYQNNLVLLFTLR